MERKLSVYMYSRCIKSLMVLLLLTVSGCASIPIATMAKFSGFGPQDVLQLNARDIRVKATLNASLGIDLVKATNISMGIKTEQGEVSLNLQLQAIQQTLIDAKPGIFSNTPAFSVQTMKLSEQGITDFEKFQQLVKSKTIKGGRFSAGLDHSRSDNKDQKNSNADETIYFSVEIKLAKQDDWITLIDRFKLEVFSISSNYQVVYRSFVHPSS